MLSVRTLHFTLNISYFQEKHDQEAFHLIYMFAFACYDFYQL